MLGALRDYSKDLEGIEVLTNGLGLNQTLAVCVKFIVKGGTGKNPLQDLQIAKWYLDRELGRLVDIESNKLVAKEYRAQFSHGHSFND